MPRCSICRKSVPGADLGPVPDQVTDKGPVLACRSCRGLKAVPPVQEAVSTLQEEVTVAKNEEKQPIATLNVFELDEDDYRLDLNVKIGGVRIEVSKKVSEIRDFFTKRKDKQGRGRRELQSVPKDK
jgi:hypothetical protein